MPTTPESRARTRAFARVIGPFVLIVPLIIAIRLPAMGHLDFFALPIIVWLFGALLLFCGLLIIANHQYWSSGPAIAISLFGWFLALRGLVLLAVPELMERGVSASMTMVPAAQVGFVLLASLGAWLTFVGWISRAFAPEPAPAR
ncbi:hypothetical protein [Nannocystis pusilla]|uniref:hypothetical protein n=1 Tax=Nannocystis pusilla TaxID=889268 RepID=UPI0032085B5C